MYIFRAIFTFISVLCVSYVGDIPNDSRSYFISRFVLYGMLTLDYINFYVQNKDNYFARCFYIFAWITGIITLIEFMGVAGFIVLNRLDGEYLIKHSPDNVVLDKILFWDPNLVSYVFLTALLIILIIIIEMVFNLRSNTRSTPVTATSTTTVQG